MPTDIDGLKERFREHGVPDGATAVNGHTAADVVGTTPIALTGLAAPGAANAYFITQIIAVNKTAAETPVLVLQEAAAGTPLAFFVPADAAGDRGSLSLSFDPPIKAAANKALEVAALTAVGDCRVTVLGYDGVA